MVSAICLEPSQRQPPHLPEAEEAEEEVLAVLPVAVNVVAAAVASAAVGGRVAAAGLWASAPEELVRRSVIT